jgi:GntR family transcriptional regulator, transcriptional repressor for pyruvate dehydrogenase complex
MAFELESLGPPLRRADGVFQQLRSRILVGALAPGEQLPNERDLADTFEVNRTSVREAVKRLEFLELVEVRHGLGTFVKGVSESSSLEVIEALLRDPRTVTRDLLRQILEFRRHITLQVVELAARHRTDEQLERARALLSKERAEGMNPTRALALDVELNRLLGEATGNLMYQLVSNLFTKLLHRLGPFYYNEGRDFSRSLETHAQLLDALEVRDPVGARRVLERMLAYSESAIVGEMGRLEAEGRIGPQTRAALEGRGEAARGTREREPSAVASSRPPGPGVQS